LGIKRDVHELPYSILTFLSGKLRSVGLRKKENRGERELRAFKVGNCLFSFIVLSAIILSISSLRMFYFLRRLSSRSFRITSRCYLVKRVVFAFASIVLLNNSFFCRSRRSIFASGGVSSQDRFARKYCSQYFDRSEITQRRPREI
jgi:hypothetical protein